MRSPGMLGLFDILYVEVRLLSTSFGELCAHMIWPVSCPVCGMAGCVLCDACLRSLARIPLPRCLWCGETIPCHTHGGDAKIRAGFFYEGVMREIILMLKHGGYKALGIRLGRGMAKILARPEADVLVPVPLHDESRRRYNQAEEIAFGLGAVWGIEVREAAYWTRKVDTRTGMTGKERAALPPDAFGCEGVEGRRIALVDDVCTTGTTLARLGLACRAAGASVIGAFVAAHSPA